MALPGKNFVVKVATDAIGGSYTAVDEINKCTFNINGDLIDITDFGSTWKIHAQALKNAEITMSGFWDPSDTNGQVAIRTAMVNNSSLFCQFLPNGSAGFAIKVEPRVFNQGADVGAMCTVDITLVGTGDPQAV